MAVRSQIAYIGRFVRRKLGLGSYLPLAVTAAANPTTLRILNPEIFDPVGGTIYYVNQAGADKYFTYTGINLDTLTGIPASGAGEIDSDLYDFNEQTNIPTLVYRADLDDEEIERAIDAYKKFVVEELFDDASGEGKRWKTLLGWFDTAAQIRTDYDDTYTVITPGGSDTISYERGEVIFNTARTESQLWFAGFAFNPFGTIANLILQHANDSRFLNYFQIGQTAQTKITASDLAKIWHGYGAALNFCR